MGKQKDEIFLFLNLNAYLIKRAPWSYDYIGYDCMAKEIDDNKVDESEVNLLGAPSSRGWTSSSDLGKNLVLKGFFFREMAILLC